MLLLAADIMTEATLMHSLLHEEPMMRFKVRSVEKAPVFRSFLVLVLKFGCFIS